MEVEGDEKKPFEAVDQDNDQMPDPDETLMLDQGKPPVVVAKLLLTRATPGHGRVWLVKVALFLWPLLAC